jgi:hypothetical protein
MKHRLTLRPTALVAGLAAAALLAGGALSLLGLCPPFTDVAADSFCPLVQEIFSLGITTGTTLTTFDPAGNVSRLQMAAFLSRTVDRTLQRAGKRAALDQYWTSKAAASFGLTTVGAGPAAVRSDGEDVWVGSQGDNTISRVHASDGRLLGT